MSPGDPTDPTDPRDAPHGVPARADLEWGEDGAPRSRRYGDVYFSVQDGLAESRAVFLGGLDFPALASDRPCTVIGELGLGTGLNVCALIRAFRQARGPGQRLHVFSIEAHPMSRDEARRALAHWPDIAEEAEAMLERWPLARPGFHRIGLPQWGTTVDVAIGDVGWALEQWQGGADGWMLDGFSPARNPAMWSESTLRAVTQRSRPGARLATFTVAGQVRRDLAALGWQVEKKPGFGRKRERLEARLTGPVPGTSAPSSIVAPASIAIIGAGIAGACLAHGARARGIEVHLIEDDTPAGSGFRAALVTPRFDLGHPDIAALHQSALAFARDLYAAIPGAITAEGVLRLFGRGFDETRAQRLLCAWNTPSEPPSLALLDAAETGARLGREGEAAASGGAMLIGAALAIDAPAVIKGLKDAIPVTGARAASISCEDDSAILRDEDGGVIAQADHVIIAAGASSARLGALRAIRPVRGQAEWVGGIDAPAFSYGGYVAPGADGVLFGATHDRDEWTCEPREHDRMRNLASLAGVAPELAGRMLAQPLSSRAAVRATTPDHLPLCGPMGDQVSVLTGLGSRGFTLAPLLAEHLIATLCGEPSPLPVDQADLLRPDRF
ncbi:MAG: tRNA (5-methylaminomethyl-2-thiouridine)(34)-methyltransferase MnmD [Brevundimonas sp.]|uniref:tRNA (5-methylaminomethyl-2-thiouridine)(34)-methyltransferase MnmD n=1 Tax=Brevundimonas sp. TaxID=1871086 RepID=UPI003919A1E9